MATPHAAAWKLRIHPRTKIQFVRFRHEGVRHEYSTGTRDPRLAAVEAAKKYTEVVSGRRVARPVSTQLDATVAEYLEAHGKMNSAEWTKIVSTYFRAHLLPFFEGFDRFTLPAYHDYMRERLQEVTRVTLRHEVSALRIFVEWCNVEREMSLPAVPSVPKTGQPGNRHKNARKRKADIIEPAELAKILMAMPERSKRTGFFVRPLFTVIYETGLRPITVLRLETPLHYKKGSKTLFVSREIDKEGFEREVPLSNAARKALDRVCPSKPGRLFNAPRHSLRKYFELAVEKAGLSHRNFSVYDLKHTRISLGANMADVPLAGIAYMVGHKHISTTALYVQTGPKAAAEAVTRMSGGTKWGDKSSKRGAKGGT